MSYYKTLGKNEPLVLNEQIKALDKLSFQFLKLENSCAEQFLEFHLGQFSLQVVQDCFICFAGATRKITINGKKLTLQERSFVLARDVIEVGFAQRGNYTYMSFACREGKKQAGVYQPLKITKELVLPVLKTYQHDDFASEQVEKFCQIIYKISTLSNRVGFRLEGEAIQVPYKQMVSEGVSLGAVQITTSGKPIILLDDRPTIGGYCKIGTLLKKDLNNLVQQKVGTNIRFEFI